MIEGLWTAVFSSGGISGAGVIYLSDGQAVGGDNQYFYNGPYTFDQSSGLLQAKLRVTAFVRGAIAVFGRPISAFTLDLKGTVSGDTATAVGSVSELPTLTIQVQLIRRIAKIPR
jgi:hypothetical protein